MDFFRFALTFLVGSLFGVIMFIAYGTYRINQLNKKTKGELMEQLNKAAAAKQPATSQTALTEQQRISIRERLLQAAELAQTQMAIREQLEMPSKNALHSKYKGDLVAEMHELEQHKIDLLRTILAEGFDPYISVVNESGHKEEIPLSSYVNTMVSSLSAVTGDVPAPPPSAEGADQPRKVGKFFVYNGGKSDGTH